MPDDHTTAVTASDSNRNSHAQGYKPPITADWMYNHRQYLGPLKLNQACLLGSHDSATAAISRQSSFGADAKSKVGFWHYLPFAHSIAAEWARTQKLFIFDQLIAGVRYLDFRICQTKKNVLYTSHALLGRPIHYVIEAIRSFMQAHPKEILFLDFNHFYAMKENDHEQLIQLLVQAFGDKILPRAAELNITFDQLWQTNYRVVIFYHHHLSTLHHPCLWRAEQVYSIWPDVLRFRSLQRFLEQNLQEQQQTRLIIRQCILSPSFWQIFRSLLTFTMFPASLSLLAERVNRKVLRWLKNLPMDKRQHVGVIMIDWCTEETAMEFFEFTKATNLFLSEGQTNTHMDPS